MVSGFGAFGKIPSLGDFFRMGVAAGFVGVWDDWLQRGIVAGRARLGDGWQDCYMTAPIWRFTLAPGLAGAPGAMGVLMPSVDRVGRQFPLTLVATPPEPFDPVTAHFGAGAVFAALEDLALDALDDMPRDKLAERLSGIDWQPEDAGGKVTVRPGCTVVTGGGAGGGLPDLAADCLRRDFRAPSVWSAATEGGSRLMVLEGLPDEAMTVGLFDLDAPVWQRREAA